MKSERIARLREQQRREEERHRAAVARLSADRAEALTVEDPARRTARLAKIGARQMDEASRHRDRIADLGRRLRAAWA